MHVCTAFTLTHPSPSQLLQPQYLSEQRLLVEPFLSWGGLFRERYWWDDNAWQQRIASSDHGKGSYSSCLSDCEAKKHERRANMVGPKCIQPLTQSSVDRVLDSANDAFYLPIALAVTSHWCLMHDAKHFAQACKTPLELRPMVHSYVPWLTPSVHDVLQELCCTPAVQRGNRASFHPLGEGINRDEKELVSIGVLRKRTRGIDTPAEEGCRPLVDPVQVLQRRW